MGHFIAVLAQTGSGSGKKPSADQLYRVLGGCAIGLAAIAVGVYVVRRVRKYLKDEELL